MTQDTAGNRIPVYVREFVGEDPFAGMSDEEINRTLLELSERYQSEIGYTVLEGPRGRRTIIRIGSVTPGGVPNVSGEFRFPGEHFVDSRHTQPGHGVPTASPGDRAVVARQGVPETIIQRDFDTGGVLTHVEAPGHNP